MTSVNALVTLLEAFYSAILHNNYISLLSDLCTCVHIKMFLYLIQVQGVLYTVISATSYYQCSGSTSFEIARVVYGQQCNPYSHTEIQAESIWQI